ncbi:MAG: oxidoreductase [Cyanobium sp. CACIAM 14]|nr:MAG: oxidoreductase [Cyanobium sp. CACIAM 14]
MTDRLQTHAIAPAQVLRGPSAWRQALPRIVPLGQRPLLLGRSTGTAALRRRLAVDLEEAGCRPLVSQRLRDCCDEDLEPLAAEAAAAGCDAVIAAGGGKVLDAGKLLAQRLGLACITVPTSAATCAGWTALANLYTPDGAFLGDVTLERCPELLIFDHDLVRQAPARTLASGIADALAKWYEASVSSGSSGDGLVQQAVQMARILRDLLLLEGERAMADPFGESWVRVAEGCALTAGLIGGLGGARCRTVAAHAVHNGLTQLSATHGRLHGEKVGFGVLVQLSLEERLAGNRLAAQARRQLLPFFRQLDLPTDLEALGLAGATLDELRQVCRFACREDSDLHRLPFAVGPDDLLAAMVGATAERQPT